MQFIRRSLLFFSIIVLFSALAFASDSDQKQEPPEVILLPLETEAMEVRAVTHTIDDIYTLLSGTTNSTLSTISSRVQNDYTQNYQANQKLGNIVNYLSTSNVGDTLTLYGLVGEIQASTHFYVDGNHDYTLAQLLGMIWSYTQNIAHDCTVSSSYLSSINSSLNSLTGVLSTTSNIYSEIKNINWQSVNNTPLGFFHSIDQSDVTGQVVSSYGDDRDSYYFSYVVSSPYSNLVGSVLDFAVPFYSTSLSTDIEFRYLYFDNDQRVNYRLVYQYMDDHLYHFLIFLADPIPISSNVHIVFRLNDGTIRLSYNTNGSISEGYIKSLDFDSADFHTLLTSLATMSIDEKLDNNLILILGQLDAIRRSVIDPSYQSAKSASEDVIDETLDDFTGSGSASAKVSDVSSMKNASSSVKNGLDTGASVSNATNVFNTSTHFWDWFTQTTSNNINNPYPAPSVQSLRGSGDDIVDFLSGNQSDMLNMLGDQR